MAKASPQLQDESQSPQESILPRVNETVEEYSRRIDHMLKDWKSRKAEND